MAYTKEQRAKKDAEAKAKLEAEMRAKIEAEMEAKIRAEYEDKLKEAENKVAELETEKEDTSAVARKIQSSVRIPLDTIVPVICNTVGGAFYSSKKIMGYTVEWDDIGSVEYIELGELNPYQHKYTFYLTIQHLQRKDFYC